MTQRSQSGLTLIELIVVITLLALLLGLTAVMFKNANKDLGVRAASGQMIAQLRARTFRYEHVCYAFDRAEMVNQFKMHAEVLDALEQRDIENASAQLRAHWQANLELVIRTGKSVFAESEHH